MRCCALPALNFFDGMAQNVAGIDARLSRDLDDGDVAQFLRRSQAARARCGRRTVGLDDGIEGEGGVANHARNHFRACAISSSSSPAIRP